MDYRDDRQALQERVAQLEADLDVARRHATDDERLRHRAVALEQELATWKTAAVRLEGQLRTRGSGVDGSRLVATGIGILIAVVGAGIAFWLVLTARPAAPPSVPAAAPPPAPAPPPPPPEPTPTADEAHAAGDNPGFLTIVCNPYCDDVTDDGRSLGPSPIVHIAVAPGAHRVTLRKENLTKTIALTVVSGQVTAQRVAMTP